MKRAKQGHDHPVLYAVTAALATGFFATVGSMSLLNAQTAPVSAVVPAVQSTSDKDLAQIRTDIAALKAQATTGAASDTELKKSIASLDAKVQPLSGALTTLTTNLAALSSKATTNTDKIPAVLTAIEASRKDLLNAVLDLKSGAVSVSAMSERLTKMDTSITALTKSLAELATTVNAKVVPETAKIPGMITTLAKVQSDVSSLSKGVSDTNANVTTSKDAVLKWLAEYEERMDRKMACTRKYSHCATYYAAAGAMKATGEAGEKLCVDDYRNCLKGGTTYNGGFRSSYPPEYDKYR